MLSRRADAILAAVIWVVVLAFDAALVWVAVDMHSQGAPFTPKGFRWWLSGFTAPEPTHKPRIDVYFPSQAETAPQGR